MFIAYKTLWCTDIHYKMRTKIRIFFELTNHFYNFLIRRHICILADKLVHL